MIANQIMPIKSKMGIYTKVAPTSFLAIFSPFGVTKTFGLTAHLYNVYKPRSRYKMEFSVAGIICQNFKYFFADYLIFKNTRIF